MTRLTITQIPETRRAELDAIARSYFAEVLPDGPPYVPVTLDSYWRERGRHPYLIEFGTEPIGFALVWTHADGTHELAEFTIRPEWRHRGFGTDAAEMIFLALGGDWMLGVSSEPPGALTFWQHCLDTIEAAHEVNEGPPKHAAQSGCLTFRIAR